MFQVNATEFRRTAAAAIGAIVLSATFVGAAVVPAGMTPRTGAAVAAADTDQAVRLVQRDVAAQPAG